MFNSLFDGAPVDIMQMLDARERRARTQQQLLEQFNPCVLVSITLNIPGPVKNSEAITTVFASVISELDEALLPFEKLHQEDFSLGTGMEFYRVLRADALRVKRACTEFEEGHPLGRLLDIDVVEMAGDTPTPISRTALGMTPRRCFICNEDAKVCARSRKHTVLEMQEHIARIVAEYTSSKRP